MKDVEEVDQMTLLGKKLKTNIVTSLELYGSQYIIEIKMSIFWVKLPAPEKDMIWHLHKQVITL